MTSSAGVQVVVRLRPLNEREKKYGTLPVISASTNDKTVTVIKGKGERQARSQYAFDNVYTAFSTQEEVFDTTVKPVIKQVLLGFEATVFAYGQTGTGKTHTMEGSLDSPENYGVIPRSAEAIFEKLNSEDLHYESFQVYCSYLEIYNEELCDLLTENTSSNANNNNNSSLPPAGSSSRTPKRSSSMNGSINKLDIMEGPNGPVCRGLTEQQVHTAADLLELMEKAQQQRKVGETNMNKQSSRSHCIFTLRVEAKRRLPDNSLLETRGKLHVIDLAGSECAKTANMEDGAASQQAAREQERKNINRSLLTLGRVVKLLKEQSTKGSKAANVRIPYRDSKLTRILQQALGGNSKTVIFATLSPSETAIEESISTLNYAQAAHGIINKPVSASYLSEGTKTSAMLSGMESSSMSGQSLEHWKEMEIRLEYMQCQVDEAKHALARKHMQQQEIVERAEQAEADKVAVEKEMELMKERTAALEQQLVESEAKCAETEKQLQETQSVLDKTTLVLQATQKTEAKLTQEAKALIDALQQSVKDGDQLHRMLLSNREADVERRRAAKQFNFSVTALLADVKQALEALAQQETSFHEQTTELATTTSSKDIDFLEKSKEILQSAVAKVEDAVTSLKSSIHEEGGIVPTADFLAQKALSSVNNARTVVTESEQSLEEQFKSTRSMLSEFGTRLSELEKEHEECSLGTLSVLKNSVEKSKQNVEQLVASSTASLETAQNERRAIREATKNTIELWKQSLIDNGEVILQECSSHRGQVENTEQMLTSEIERHSKIQDNLKNQGNLLENGHSTSVSKFESQKELIQQTQEKAEESHRQQTQLLSVFAEKLMKDVESLVQSQVSEVMQEVKKGHTSYLENNFHMLENHGKIASATLETLAEAGALTSSLQQDAEAAKQTDTTVLARLGETKSAFSDIEKTVNNHLEVVDDYSSRSMKYMKDSEDLEAEASALRERLVTGGRSCMDYMSTGVLDKTTEKVSALSQAGAVIATFTESDILADMSSAVGKMQEPRSEVTSTFNEECSALEQLIENGVVQIKEKATVSSGMADELHDGLKSVENEFVGTTVEQRRIAIIQAKDAFLACSAEHAEYATGSIGRSGEGSTKAASAAEAFVRMDLSAFEEVEAAPERAYVPYSDQLSSTPSEDEIMRTMKKVGRDVSKVLQALSPNQEKGASAGNKRGHRGSSAGHNSLPNFSHHERNEPRSETLA